MSNTLSFSDDSIQNLSSNNTSISRSYSTSTSYKDKVKNKKKITDVTKKASKLWKDYHESQNNTLGLLKSITALVEEEFSLLSNAVNCNTARNHISKTNLCLLPRRIY